MVYSIVEAKTRFSELVKRAAYKGEAIPIGSRGKAEVVLIAAEELEKLRQLEDERDAHLLAEAVRTSTGTVTFAELLRGWERSHKRGRPQRKAKRVRTT